MDRVGERRGDVVELGAERLDDRLDLSLLAASARWRRRVARRARRAPSRSTVARFVVSPQRADSADRLGKNDDTARARSRLLVVRMGRGEHDPRVLAIDAGGTMTDTFIVDDEGSFVVGKAQTTPAGRVGRADALGRGRAAPVGLDARGGPSRGSSPRVFSGTAMLNRLLTRKGRRVGALVTAGQEDSLQMERGIQTYLGFSYADRLHIATHHHNEPADPARSRARRPRPHRPLRQRGAAAARGGRPRGGQRAARRRRRGHRASRCSSRYRNPAHEQRVREIVEEEKAKRSLNGDVPGLRLLRALPLAARLPAPQHDRDRGLRGRALARHPARRPRPHQGARRRLRAAGDGLARRHDLDRRRPAGDDARLRPDRRRRRRPLAGRPDRPQQRPLHRHRRHLVRHRPARPASATR